MFDLQLALQTILIIVLVVLVTNLHTAVQRLRDEVRGLRQELGGGAATVRPQPQPAPSRVAPSRPASQQAQAPVGQPVAPQPVARPHANASIASPEVNRQPAPRPSAPSAPQPMVAQQRYPHPPQRQSPPPAPHSPAAERSRESFENVLGTRVLGILAALLVFAGLVFLAILVVPSLTDELRCAAMFILSGALSISGAVVAQKHKAPFSQALLGCGMGSMFVSLLVAYVYFGFLHDGSATALMLVWLVVCTFFAHRHRSVALAVIAQLGMAISTCFAYLQGIRAGQLPLVVGYQIMACAIVVVGCLRSLEKGRLAGAFVSMAVSLLVSQLVTAGYSAGATGIDVTGFAVAMATQFACMTALALLVSLLASKDLARNPDKPAASGMAAHLAAEALWLLALCVDVLCAVLIATDGTRPMSGTNMAALAALGCLCLHWVAFIALQRVGLLDRRLSFVSVYLCVASGVLLLTWRMIVAAPQDSLPLVAPLGIGLWLTGAASGEQRHKTNAVALLVPDALLMAMGGYESLGQLLHAPVAFVYVALLDVLLFAWWKTLPPEQRVRRTDMTLLCGVFGTELSLVAAWSSSPLPYELAHVGCYACVLCLVAAVAFVEPRRRFGLSTPTANVIYANELACVALACINVVSRGLTRYAQASPIAAPIACGIALVLFGLTIFRLVEVATHAHESAGWKQVAAGIELSLWTACVALGLLPAGMSAVVTAVTMLTALACIALGFAKRLGALRLYGLVAALLCVLKIVMLDVSGTDPIGRVVAFMVGGVICFAISALYTIAVRRLAE